MELYQKAAELLGQDPLPDDCPEQLRALVKLAKGDEKRFIKYSFEAMYVSATEEQLALWRKNGK